VLAATQTPGEGGNEWFQGTADAVRQYLWLFEDAKNQDVENVLILSGDHLYRMDYMDFVQKHKDSGADVTISCVGMDDSRASDYGLMKINEEGQVLFFKEKPKGAELQAMQVDTTVLGLSPEEAKKKPYIASMGIYVFKKDVLLKLLRWRYPTANDFGSEIIPDAAKELSMQAYLFDDYWEDIGTIKSFFDANLALTAQPPNFSFYDAAKPIFTSPRFLPPTKIEKCQVFNKDYLLLILSSSSIYFYGKHMEEC
jgi:glucose-1-phosphate adenylyltransferase